MSGIISYGVYFPKYRLKAQEVVDVWKNAQPSVLKKMGYIERAVCGPDQDTITLAVEACQIAIERCNVRPDQINALFFGSGTSPYASKAASTVVCDALGLRRDVMSYDLQFSGKSGTSAIITAKAYVDAGMAEYALAIGVDTMSVHIPAGHVLESGASCGAAAFIIGREGVIAEINGIQSYQQDQADYFRVEGERYLQVGSGIIGYISSWGLSDNVVPNAKAYFEKTNCGPDDFEACALQQNSFIMPMMISGPLKLNVFETVLNNILTSHIGHLGAASALVALANILDDQEPELRILTLSYGEGAGSDILDITTTDAIKDYDVGDTAVFDMFERKEYVDYATAQKFERKYSRPQMIHGFI
ncbi:MAG: hydroxymethylglutaryl-CoA synthase [Firmicutes bacterium]|nr:hydroxymethylglutaryl-CoA synthase [Bacillota bacterium]